MVKKQNLNSVLIISFSLQQCSYKAGIFTLDKMSSFALMVYGVCAKFILHNDIMCVRGPGFRVLNSLTDPSSGVYLRTYENIALMMVSLSGSRTVVEHMVAATEHRVSSR